MEKLDWEDVETAAKTAPDVKELSDFISMKGAFDVFIPKKEHLSSELYEITSGVEEKLRQAYPGLQIVGEESKNEVWKQYPGTRYFGNIYGSDGSDVLFKITIEGVETIVLAPQSLLTFFGVFPLTRDYAAQTRTALSQIWQYVHGIDFVFPPGEKSKIPVNKQGQHSILLVKDGKPAASGEYALKEANIPVKMKKGMMSGGILI